MGVAIDGDYAEVWFGQDSDPAGPVPTTDTPEAEAAYAGLTLAARDEGGIRAGRVEFVLRKATPGSASLVGAYYEIEKDVDGEWRSYYTERNPIAGGSRRRSSSSAAWRRRSSGTSARGAIPITSPRGAGTG